MSRRFTRFDQQQFQIDVAQNTQDNNLVVVWFYALAVVVAGAFYFWYYFWGSPWGAF